MVIIIITGLVNVQQATRNLCNSKAGFMSSSSNLFLLHHLASIYRCVQVSEYVFFRAAPKGIIFAFPRMCNEWVISRFKIGSSAPVFSHIFLKVLRKTMRRPSQDYCRAKIQTQNIAGLLISFAASFVKNNGGDLHLHFSNILSPSMRLTLPPADAHKLINTLCTVFALKLTDLKRHTSLQREKLIMQHLLVFAG